MSASQASVSGSAARPASSSPCRIRFDSLETCLQDAGDSLGHYFPRVQMRYEGSVVGACTTELLRRNPKGLAERFLAALSLRRSAAALPGGSGFTAHFDPPRRPG
ncbi:MAG: hypothetical protein QM586_17975 [Xenophilus sp.]